MRAFSVFASLPRILRTLAHTVRDGHRGAARPGTVRVAAFAGVEVFGAKQARVSRSDRDFVIRVPRWQVDEDPTLLVGDRLEVSLRDFDGELHDAAGAALDVRDVRNLRFSSGAGVEGRSYRVRVVAIDEVDDGVELTVVPEDRERLDVQAIPLPGES
ncbi:MAG TPA: hypothetical protein VFB22_11370 [Candidatus Baltobacteraceae bacterium]|nr:hypothetical protein [Candidatus Baltobacteraceae bacterium]